MQKLLSRMSGFLVFLMLLFFGTSAFATEGNATAEGEFEQTPINDWIGNPGESDNTFGDFSGSSVENLVIEEFVDEEGKNNKLVADINEEETIVSLYIEGELEQQSVLNRETQLITGFSEYGENEFERDAQEMLTEEDYSPEEVIISPMAVGYYSQVATRASVPNAACNKKVTAILTEKSTTIGTSKYYFAFAKGDLITSIIATIVGALVLKSTVGITLVKEMLVNIGIGVTTTTIASSYKGAYHLRKEIKDYLGKINGTTYFTNKITKEYLTLYNTYNSKSTVKYLGQDVTAYGDPTSYQTMLSHAIVNWANGTKCK